MQYVYVLRYFQIDPFLLLARNFPNVEVYDINVGMYIDDRPTDRPPATDQRPATDDRQPTSHFEKFEWPHLRNGSSDPLHVWF